MYIVIRNTSLRNSTFGEYCQHVFTYKHHGALILCYAFLQQLVHLLVKAGDCRSGQAKSQRIDKTPSYENSLATAVSESIWVMLNAAQNLCPATARAKGTKQWHLGAHGSPKGAQKEHLGGLLATFYGPGEKSENGAPA